MKGSPTWQLVATAPGNDRRSPCSASSRRPCGWRRQALLDVLADWVFTQIDPLANGFPTPMATHAFSAIDAHVYGFVPAEQYPHLSAMLHEQVLGHGYDFADEFDFGLELILDGLQRRLVWVHGERLSVTNEAMTAYPHAPAVFVWDEELWERNRYAPAGAR